MKFGKIEYFLFVFLIVYVILWVVLLPFYEICGMSHPPVCKLHIDWLRLGLLILIGVFGISSYIYLKKRK